MGTYLVVDGKMRTRWWGAVVMGVHISGMSSSGSVVLWLVLGGLLLLGGHYVANVMISASCVSLFGFGQSQHFQGGFLIGFDTWDVGRISLASSVLRIWEWRY